MRQVLRRLGAVLIACALTALVVCDLVVSGFRAWWDGHALTTSVVSSLLIVGATALISGRPMSRCWPGSRPTTSPASAPWAS